MRLNEQSLEYVSVETAKLLKEKGFNYPVNMYYIPDKCGNKFYGAVRKDINYFNHNIYI